MSRSAGMGAGRQRARVLMQGPAANGGRWAGSGPATGFRQAERVAGTAGDREADLSV